MVVQTGLLRAIKDKSVTKKPSKPQPKTYLITQTKPVLVKMMDLKIEEKEKAEAKIDPKLREFL